MRSWPATASAMDVATVAFARSAWSSRAVRFQTVTSWPAARRLRTIPEPMMPRPMKAMDVIRRSFARG